MENKEVEQMLEPIKVGFTLLEYELKQKLKAIDKNVMPSSKYPIISDKMQKHFKDYRGCPRGAIGVAGHNPHEKFKSLNKAFEEGMKNEIFMV